MSSYYIPQTIYDNTSYFETCNELSKFLGAANLEFNANIRGYEQNRSESLFGSLW